MKAMILAAGVGSRLRPLTDTVPKALVEVGGASMLEIVARRLKAAGVTDVVINVHHHAGAVAAFLRGRDLGLRVELSREDDLLLDTGGGLKKAARFLAGDEPFLVHNVDVLSSIDLRALWQSQRGSEALATLAVHDRPTKRKLAFSRDGRLLGRAPQPGADALAFTGVHAVSPRLFSLITETGVFSITDVYARLASEGRLIRGWRCDQAYWADIGDMTKLDAARRRAEAEGLPA